jgi:hypothetical protein
VKASRDNGIRTSRNDNPGGDTSHWQCRPAQHVVLVFSVVVSDVDVVVYST